MHGLLEHLQGDKLYVRQKYELNKSLAKKAGYFSHISKPFRNALRDQDFIAFILFQSVSLFAKAFTTEAGQFCFQHAKKIAGPTALKIERFFNFPSAGQINSNAQQQNN